MPEIDLDRVITASRDFIATLKRHARQYNAPGNETADSAFEVLRAGGELHLALEGRTPFDPPRPVDNPGFRVFVGQGAPEAARQCGIIRECLRRSLRRTGYRGSQRAPGEPYVDFSYGTMPSVEGLEDLPQVGLPELEFLIDATDELEDLARRFGPIRLSSEAIPIVEATPEDIAVIASVDGGNNPVPREPASPTHPAPDEPAPAELVARGYRRMTVRAAAEAFNVSSGDARATGLRALTAGKIRDFKVVGRNLWILSQPGHPGT